jgi:hypothetical protein
MLMGISACPTDNSSDNTQTSNQPKPATINFFNESSFKVDLYKNLNPQQFDPTTLACSVDAGSTIKVTVYPSSDQVIGDVFYPRYKMLLADSLETGTTNIYVDAQRDLSNISFVVEEGKTYTKVIQQPQQGQLRFINGYIEVQNQGSNQIQVIKGDQILHKLDNEGVYLNAGTSKGYYEIPFSYFDTTITAQLKAYNGSYMDFPAVSMERGKIYSFVCSNTGITANGVRNISPLQ